MTEQKLTPIEVLSITPGPASAKAIKAFVTVRVGNIIIHDGKILQLEGKEAFFAPPDREFKGGDMKSRYKRVVDILPPLRERVNAFVIAEWNASQKGSAPKSTGQDWLGGLR